VLLELKVSRFESRTTKRMQAMYTGSALWICFGKRPPNGDEVGDCIVVTVVPAPDFAIDTGGGMIRGRILVRSEVFTGFAAFRYC
jgi:hypothetical protein